MEASTAQLLAPQELVDALAVVKRFGYQAIKVTSSVMPGDQAALGDFYEIAVTHDDQIIVSLKFVSDWAVRYCHDPAMPGRVARQEAWLEVAGFLGERFGVLR